MLHEKKELTMIAYSKIPGPIGNAYHDRFQSTFSRIYNLLDHPSKDHYASKYSRYKNIFVINANQGTTVCGDGNHNEEALDPSEG